MHEAKIINAAVKNRGSYPTIEEEEHEQGHNEAEKNEGNEASGSKYSFEVPKPNNVINQPSESSGKKFVMPVMTSKLNNYKKKIIKKA